MDAQKRAGSPSEHEHARRVGRVSVTFLLEVAKVDSAGAAMAPTGGFLVLATLAEPELAASFDAAAISSVAAEAAT